MTSSECSKTAMRFSVYEKGNTGRGGRKIGFGSEIGEMKF